MPGDGDGPALGIAISERMDIIEEVSPELAGWRNDPEERSLPVLLRKFVFNDGIEDYDGGVPAKKRPERNIG